MEVVNRWGFLLAAILVFGQVIAQAAEQEPSSDPVAANTVADVAAFGKGTSITVRLTSGEIFSGRLIERTATDLVIEWHGSQIPVLLTEIAQIERREETLSAPSAQGLTPNPMPAFSTAVVSYTYTGSKTGTETVYIDLPHQKAALEKRTTQAIFGETLTQTRAVIYDGHVAYSVDLDKHRAVKVELEGNVLESIFGTTGSTGGSLGEQSILGKPCTVRQSSWVKRCMWGQIPLKEEVTHPMGSKYNFTKEATDIQLDVPILEDRFVLPPDVTVKTMETMMGELEDAMQNFKKSQETKTAPQNAH